MVYHIKESMRKNITCVVGDRNAGKSMLIYTLIAEAVSTKHPVWVYGMDPDIVNTIGAKNFHSLKELENMHNCFVFIDEFTNLFDVLDRKKKKSIEASLRTISHNNVKLLLGGLPQNFNRFISSQDCTFVYKKLHISNCVQGSATKDNLKDYEGAEKGSVMLNLKPWEYLLFDSEHWVKKNVAYNEDYDTKKENVDLLEGIEE